MMDTESIVSTIEAMRRQEESSYACQDYIYQQQQEEAEDPALGPLSKYAVTNDSRAKMVQWCYKVVDFCSFNRETVAIAINVLDRFLATPEGGKVLHNRDHYQLSAMTALYTSCKIHEPEVLSSELVSTLSRGAHSPQDVEAMELRMLHSLGWKVNTPTALSYIRLYMELLPPELMLPDMKTTLYEISKFQTELAVADFTLVTVPPSMIAYCSVMNALESLYTDRNVFGYVSSILSEGARINVFSQGLLNVQVRLCDAVTQHSQPGRNGKPSMAAAIAGSPERAPRRSSYEASPCSVSNMQM